MLKLKNDVIILSHKKKNLSKMTHFVAVRKNSLP